MELELHTLPDRDKVVLSNNIKILKVNYECRGCETQVRKYIDMTPDDVLGKYLCNCKDDNGELCGPQFPLKAIKK